MKRTRNVVLGLLAMSVAWVGVIGEAKAQDSKAEKTAQKSKDRRPKGIIVLKEVTITGRVQKPIAAIDVARIRPKLTLSELRQPFIDRINASIYRMPF